MMLEFYVPSRIPPTAPLFSVVTAVAANDPNTSGEALRIDHVRWIEGGGVLIEFPSKPGSRYRVQYSSDMQTWVDAHPIVKASGNRVQWYDQGAPKTAFHPSQEDKRWYRVIELAE